MSERSALDRSAILVASVAGIVLLAVSVPFLPAFYCESPAASCPEGKYAVTWVEGPQGESELRTGATDPIAADMPLLGSYTSAVSVSVPQGGCTDSGQAPFYGPVTYSWTLTRTAAEGNETVGSGSFTCADVASGMKETFVRNELPDIVEAGGPTEEAAIAILTGKLDEKHEDAIYTLSLSATRADGQLPPVPNVTPPATQSISMKIEATSWTPTLTDAQPTEAVPK